MKNLFFTLHCLRYGIKNDHYSFYKFFALYSIASVVVMAQHSIFGAAFGAAA